MTGVRATNPTVGQMESKEHNTIKKMSRTEMDG